MTDPMPEERAREPGSMAASHPALAVVSAVPEDGKNESAGSFGRNCRKELTARSGPIKCLASGQRPAASGQRPAASGQRPAASGQRPAASGQRPAASGMTCARGPAPGWRIPSHPASSASAGSPRPDPHPGRARVRRFPLILPVLALLAGTLSLFAPVEAQATPGIPGNVQVTAGDAALTLTWQAPSTWGSTSARGYEIDWYAGATAPDSDSHDWKQANSVGSPISASATSYTFTGAYGSHTVANGTKYWLRIRATSVHPTDSDDYLAGHYATPVSGTPQAQTAPAAPTSLTVTAGDTRLSLSWTAPSGTLTGYDVHYTSAAATGSNSVANDAAVQTGAASAGWVAVSRGTETSPPTASQTISSLTNGTAYRVRVRAKNAAGGGAWVFGTGTPKTPTMEFELDTFLVVESDTDPEAAKVLISPAPAEQTTVQIRVRSYGNASPADFTLTTTTLTFAAGDTEKSFGVLAAADMLTEGNEVVTLELVAVASAPYTLGTQDSIEFVIVDDSFEPGEPGLTSLTAVESGANKPTATTLSFTVACATADSGFPLTDYHVHAVAQGVAGLERTYFFPESKCGSNGPVTLTGLPLRPTATTWRVRARARAIRGHKGVWSSTVDLATLADPAQQNAAALTATFAGVPSAHTGNDRRFSFTVNFNVSVDGGQAPTRRSFETSEGSVMQVVRVSGKKWTVHVRPHSWRKVGIALRGGRSCDDPHAVCATGGRALTTSPQASVGGAARIRVSSHWAREGTEKPVRFIVKLNRAVSHEVRVDYATKDGVGMLGGNAPATAGSDYTATSGTLVFEEGERRKMVDVAVLDDSIDEGSEYFLLALSNPQGAHLPHRQVERVGLIRNDDALQRAWLSRFGRTVGSHVTDAVSGRLEGDLAPGTHATLAGQALDLSGGEDGDPLMDVLTGLAQRSGSPAPDDGDPFARLGAGDRWNDSGLAGTAGTAGTAGNTGKISMTGREVLLGSSFHTAGRMDGSGPGLAAWGRVAHGGFDGERVLGLT